MARIRFRPGRVGPALLFLIAVVGALRGSAPAAGAAPGEPRKGSFIVLPIVFYSPETKLAGGVGGLLTLRSPKATATDRPSSMYFYAIYTQMKQFTLSWEPEIYIGREAWWLKGRFLFERYPDKFWGIGPDAPDTAEECYTPRTMMFEGYFLRQLVPSAGLYAGLQFRYERLRMLGTEPGGSLDRGAVGGSAGSTVAGVGLAVSRDSRDDIFFPRRGDYWLASLLRYSKALGGGFSYSHLKVDGRKYLPVGAKHVLAFHGQFQLITGTPPFTGYAKLGHDTMMRGYYAGRYRDKVMAAFQAEYRAPLFWRLGIVGFAGLGNVSPMLRTLDLGRPKPSYGAGLRFRVSSREATNIRVDFAFGKGTSGVYFTAREAF